MDSRHRSGECTALLTLERNMFGIVVTSGAEPTELVFTIRIRTKNTGKQVRRKIAGQSHIFWDPDLALTKTRGPFLRG